MYNSEIETAKEFLQALHEHGGFYTSLDPKGKRVGPMVGYAGTYENNDGAKKQYIGDIYANCSKLEKIPANLNYFLRRTYWQIEDTIYSSGMTEVLSSQSKNRIVLLGAPMGGITTAALLSLDLFPGKTEFGFLEKKVIALASQNSREKSELIFGRHEIFPGDLVIPVEDVCNNFSTTRQMLTLIAKKGGRVLCIFCLVNRSGKKSYTFESEEFGKKEIPIVSIVLANWPEYKQDDPEIKDYITVPENLILNPKHNWDKLMSDMANRK